MDRRGLSTLALTASLAACAGGPASPAPERALAYDVPEAAPTYSTADTMRFMIQAGDMGSVQIAVQYQGTAQLTFEPAAGDFNVTVSLVSFEGRFSNPMAGSLDSDASGLGGPIVVRVTSRGETELVEVPSVTDAFDQIAGPDELVRDFFVRLPGRPVEVGGTWTDTIRSRTEGAGTLTISQSILTATVDGDTTMAGRTLRLIRTVYDNTLNLSGTSGGTRVSQRLTGTTTGYFLWDMERRLLFERHEEGSLSGSLSLPDMGIDGLPVEATVKRVVRLQ